ncbi:hypothetical protein HZB00_03555 [Candidatus Woesearchaeota archaeon]|nr:hypothetical protein [Candidatus Woesearchaeota archaeon]
MAMEVSFLAIISIGIAALLFFSFRKLLFGENAQEHSGAGEIRESASSTSQSLEDIEKGEKATSALEQNGVRLLSQGENLTKIKESYLQRAMQYAVQGSPEMLAPLKQCMEVIQRGINEEPKYIKTIEQNINNSTNNLSKAESNIRRSIEAQNKIIIAAQQSKNEQEIVLSQKEIEALRKQENDIVIAFGFFIQIKKNIEAQRMMLNAGVLSFWKESEMKLAKKIHNLLDHPDWQKNMGQIQQYLQSMQQIEKEHFNKMLENKRLLDQVIPLTAALLKKTSEAKEGTMEELQAA